MSTRDEVRALWGVCGGNISEIARRLGISRSTVRHHVQKLGWYGEKPPSRGSIEQASVEVMDLPIPGRVNRFICTCIQNNTKIHDQFWENIQVFADHYNAKILVSTFNYDVMSYGKMSTKRGKTPPANEYKDLWYDYHVDEYIEMGDQFLELAPGLMWCGHLNILPTAKNPLAGLDTFTGSKSAIFPHTKRALTCIPSAKFDSTKFNYTTGTIGLRNYIKKKAGIVAEVSHCYGFLLVEVDDKGMWFVRQVDASEDGSFQDLDVFVDNGQLSTDQRVEAITWGDIHVAAIDKAIVEVSWGEDGMFDTLQPKYQFFHDIIDFRSRNHHDRNNPHRMFKRYVEQKDDVEKELKEVVDFLWFTHRSWCQSVVVNSNHDNAFERWLRETDYRYDPKNAIFFLKAQLAKYEAIEAGVPLLMSNWAMRTLGCPGQIELLEVDESYRICQDTGGIECGMHGHNGPNGARGTPRNLSRLGKKANTGHTHTAQIIDGVYVAGTSSRLSLEWHQGPSSWSHSHIVTYPNGKRTIITIWGGKWRA